MLMLLEWYKYLKIRLWHIKEYHIYSDEQRVQEMLTALQRQLREKDLQSRM